MDFQTQRPHKTKLVRMFPAIISVHRGVIFVLNKCLRAAWRHNKMAPYSKNVKLSFASPVAQWQITDCDKNCNLKNRRKILAAFRKTELSDFQNQSHFWLKEKMKTHLMSVNKTLCYDQLLMPGQEYFITLGQVGLDCISLPFRNYINSNTDCTVAQLLALLLSSKKTMGWN